MTERHAEPGTDVGSFLPRPGEPVGAYAERLRALHRDLTLVLEAVERGLAASSRPEEEPPAPADWDPATGTPMPRPRRFQRRGGEEATFEHGPEEPPARHHEVVDVRPQAAPSPGERDVGPLRSPVPVRPSAARVVVMPSGTGALSRDDEQREADRPDPRATEPVERTMAPPALPPGRRADNGTTEAPAWPPPAPVVRTARLSPVFVALAVAGWLTALALILAVALGL